MRIFQLANWVFLAFFLLYAAGRFGYSAEQAYVERAAEIQAAPAYLQQLGRRAKPFLQEERIDALIYMLERAQGNQLTGYQLWKDKELLSQAGDWKKGASTQVTEDKYRLRLSFDWTWKAKLLEIWQDLFTELSSMAMVLAAFLLFRHWKYRPEDLKPSPIQVHGFSLEKESSSRVNISAGVRRPVRLVVTDRIPKSEAELLQLFANWQEVTTQELLPQLKTIRAELFTPTLQSTFAQILRVEQDPFRLATLLSFGAHLGHSSQLEEELRAAFHAHLTHENARVVANAVDALAELTPGERLPAEKKLLRHPHHRVTANMLVKLAREGELEKAAFQLEDRLKKGNVAQVASGLYALGSIIAFHGTEPREDMSMAVILRLVRSLGKWQQHPNAMVERQATAALAKIKGRDQAA